MDWYYIIDDDENFIDEIRFYGREIEYFYNPAHTFQRETKYKDEEYLIVDSISVQVTECKVLDCGNYSSSGMKADISCCSYATMDYKSSSPLDSKSYLGMKFSKKISIDEMVSKARTVTSFLKYVCYRTNSEISDISTYIKIENDKVRNCGKLIFYTDNKEEENKKAQESIIKAEFLKERTSKLLQTIEEGKIPFGHLCESIEDMSHYPISRIIIILTAFEREFRDIYGQDVRRSEKYKETKNQVVELVKKHAKTMTGKQKNMLRIFLKLSRIMILAMVTILSML